MLFNLVERSLLDGIIQASANPSLRFRRSRFGRACRPVTKGTKAIKKASRYVLQASQVIAALLH
jgi:hypothetical protein